MVGIINLWDCSLASLAILLNLCNFLLKSSFLNLQTHRLDWTKIIFLTPISVAFWITKSNLSPLGKQYKRVISTFNSLLLVNVSIISKEKGDNEVMFNK